MTLTGSTAAIIGSSTFTEVTAAAPSTNELVTISLLAGAAGYQAVWGVAHALHTPLMSVTNAISGLTAVGGMLIIGQGGGVLAQAMAFGSVGISSINIFGGFAVTKRMLDLFRKPGEKDHSMYMGIPTGLLMLSPFGLPASVFSTNTLSSLLCIGAIGGLSS